MGVRESEGLFWGAAIHPGAALSGPAQLSLCSQASSREVPLGSFCPGPVALQPLFSSELLYLCLQADNSLDSRAAEFEGSC